MNFRSSLFLTSAVSLLLAQSAPAQSEADFYAGKTVKIVIGASMGGEYGHYSQLIAQHIGKFVPGMPTVIVQSMPGAGGMTALNFVANVAPQDGTVLSLPQLSLVQEGLLNPKVKFDPKTFQWIGRLRTQVQVGVAWSKSGVRSLAGAKTKELNAGATGINNPTGLNPRILNVLADTKFKVVTGYRGTQGVMLAWERGEVDVVTTSWDNITRRYGDQLKRGELHPLYVHAMQRPSELADVPLISDFGRTDEQKAFLQIYTVGTEIGRSLAAPPGMPKQRTAIWRTAFQNMLADPEFKQAARKAQMPIDPLTGEELAAKVAGSMALPTEKIEQARTFYNRLLVKNKKSSR